VIPKTLAGEPPRDTTRSPPRIPATPGPTGFARCKERTAVLHFVWESGRPVVSWNIAITRLSWHFLRIAIGIIGRFIMKESTRIRIQSRLPQHFWWLVGAEMALAGTDRGILSRAKPGSRHQALPGFLGDRVCVSRASPASFESRVVEDMFDFQAARTALDRGTGRVVALAP